MSEQTLTITDNRTGKSFALPIEKDRARDGLAPDQKGPGRFRADDL